MRFSPMAGIACGPASAVSFSTEFRKLLLTSLNSRWWQLSIRLAIDLDRLEVSVILHVVRLRPRGFAIGEIDQRKHPLHQHVQFLNRRSSANRQQLAQLT